MYAANSSGGGVIESKFFSDLGGSEKQIRSPSSSQKNSQDVKVHSDETDRHFVDVEVFRKRISELTPYRDKLVTSLPKTIQDKIYQLSDFFTAMYVTPFYAVAIDIIKESFGDQKFIQPDTVASFFYGCFTPTDYDGPMHCSAICAGNVVPPPGEGRTVCGSNVYHLMIDGEMVPRYIAGTKKAIIHVFQPSFRGLTLSQVEHLKSTEVDTLDINLITRDVKHQPLFKDLSINDVAILPSSANVQNSAPSKTASHRSVSQGVRGSTNSSPVSNSLPNSNSQEAKILQSSGSSGTFVENGEILAKTPNKRYSDSREEQGDKNNWGVVAAVIFIIVIIFVVILIAVLYKNHRPIDKPYGDNYSPTTKKSFASSASDVKSDAGPMNPADFWSGY